MAKKQAVLLIHGIGEQRPMSSLRGFVDTVWTTHQEIHKEEAANRGHVVWSKPDFVSNSYELRRLTTIQNKKNRCTDFFEFYWAHMMPGNRWWHIAAWGKLLLLRAPWNIPPQLRGLWLLLIVLVALPVVATVVGALGGSLPASISGSTSLFVSIVTGRFVVDRVGDAARYLNAAAPNIDRRHKIRSAGVEILQKLHARKTKSGKPYYERIVLVGHSLGSVIGYDILTHSWARLDRTPECSQQDQRTDALESLNRSDPAADGDGFSNAQMNYLEELASQGVDWRVTDFITLGCPLAHAPLLLARSQEDFERRIKDRELPTCPPEGENGSLAYKRDGLLIPNHAAVFGPTRWTNLYFPAKFLIWGDFISGPLGEILGQGIRDLPLSTRRRWGFLAHTLYWDEKAQRTNEEHIDTLRSSLDL